MGIAARKFIRRHKRDAIIIVFCVIVVLITCVVITVNQKRFMVLVRDAGYLSRPIWDKDSAAPSIIIPQYYSPNLANKSTLCDLHFWTLRSPGQSGLAAFRVIDAVIFSIELDLLEIRMRELWDVVDVFLVLEATRTFTGKPKELYLQQNMDQFEWAKGKMRHNVFDGLVSQLPDGQSPFYNEIRMRRRMGDWVHEVAHYGDLIIVSDIDEIPRRQTIELLRTCDGHPATVHLQLKNYLYSFEFHQTLNSNWKPRVQLFNSSFGYSHGRSSDYLLIDAGWHCSFCFPHLYDFVFKMAAYSHTDRLTDPALAEYDAIQKRICNGEDIFNMYPEAYTFKDLFTSMGPIPKTNSVMFVPNYVTENANRFRYLLPGGCARSQ